MLIKYQPRCRQSDKKVCSDETSRLQGKQPLDLLLGSQCRPGNWEGFISFPFSFPELPKTPFCRRILHISCASPAGISSRLHGACHIPVAHNISFLRWLRETEGSQAMPSHSPGRVCSSAFPPLFCFFRKHIFCCLEIMAFTQQRF